MQNKQIKQGRAMSMTGGITCGLCWSFLITVAAIALLAKMVDTETLSWESVGYGIMLTLITSSFAGSKIAVGKVKRRKLLVCAMSGSIYFCLLLIITTLFFGGNYYAVVETALLILCGCGLSMLAGLNEGKQRSHKRYRRS